MNLYFCLFLQEKDTKRLRFFQFYKRQNVMAANMINTLKRVSEYYPILEQYSLFHDDVVDNAGSSEDIFFNILSSQ